MPGRPPAVTGGASQATETAHGVGQRRSAGHHNFGYVVALADPDVGQVGDGPTGVGKHCRRRCSEPRQAAGRVPQALYGEGNSPPAIVAHRTLRKSAVAPRCTARPCAVSVDVPARIGSRSRPRSRWSLRRASRTTALRFASVRAPVRMLLTARAESQLTSSTRNMASRTPGT